MSLFIESVGTVARLPASPRYSSYQLQESALNQTQIQPRIRDRCSPESETDAPRNHRKKYPEIGFPFPVVLNIGNIPNMPSDLMFERIVSGVVVPMG